MTDFSCLLLRGVVLSRASASPTSASPTTISAAVSTCSLDAGPLEALVIACCLGSVPSVDWRVLGLAAPTLALSVFALLRLSTSFVLNCPSLCSIHKAFSPSLINALMAASLVNITSRLSGDKFTSYIEGGKVNASTQAGRRLPPPPPLTSAAGSNIRQTSPSTRDTLGKSTGRPLMLKNCKSRALAGRGEVGACDIRPVIFHFGSSPISPCI